MPTTRYVPDTFEQECICLLYKWLAENDFQNPDLPPIYCSFETPPVFEKIPQDWQKIFADDLIWDALNGDDKQNEELNDNQKGLLKKLQENKLTRENIISIDGVLGLYCPKGASGNPPENNRKETPEIILYAQGITAIAKRLNVPTEMLRAVVLVHEIGHWISYEVQNSKSGKKSEVLSNIGKEKEEVQELWAQIFAYWVAKEVQGLFKLTFETLNVNQRSVYSTFKNFTEEKKTTMLQLISTYHRELEVKEKITKCEKYEAFLEPKSLKEAIQRHEFNIKNSSDTIKDSCIF